MDYQFLLKKIYITKNKKDLLMYHVKPPDNSKRGITKHLVTYLLFKKWWSLVHYHAVCVLVDVTLTYIHSSWYHRWRVTFHCGHITHGWAVPVKRQMVLNCKKCSWKCHCLDKCERSVLLRHFRSQVHS